MKLLRTVLGTAILGAAGTAIGQTALEPIRTVEIGSRAELRVNGKPLFPLMLWLQAPRDFRRQRELGFNVMAGYPGERGRMDEYGALVWKAGMYFVASLPRQIGEDARKIAGSEGLLGWIQGDEPDMPRDVSDAEITPGPRMRVNPQTPFYRLAPAILAEPAKAGIEMTLAGDLKCHLMATEHEGATAATVPEEIVFAVRQPGVGSHWYENFGYYAQDERAKVYRAMGRLCRWNLRTGKLTVLLDDAKGSVRDPQVHYDGRKVLFSYRPGGSDYFHLCEMNIDGTGLRELTTGPYDDIEPTWLPDGRIMFCSSRANRWVNCWYTQVAILYSCDADGGNLHPVSANIEHDNSPWPLPDGRVIYTRWEYVDRSRVSFHHLWTANPDGTGQMVYYGNLHPGTVMLDAKPIPGTNQVVAVFSPGHGQKEHAGAITIVTPKSGPDDKGSARKISQGDDYRDPYPLSPDCFLVAQGPRLLVMDAQGQTAEVYHLPPELAKAGAECHEPRPLAARPREIGILPRVSLKETTGRLVLSDVYQGRRMEGVRRGEIKKLLVLETLPKPVNESGKMPPMSFGGTFTLERVLGTVPVEPDGSAYLEVPALRSLFFVALDEHDNSVQRMMSFLTVMPGETTSCVGCHEERTRTPVNAERNAFQAVRRAPSRITPIPGIPEVFDFPRDIQPILDKHCVRCHDYDRRDGRVVLCGDRGPIYSHSYYTLTALGHVSDGRDRVVTNLPPRAIGTAASPMMKMLDPRHYDVQLTSHEKDMVRYWIESAAPYPGTYAALGTGMIGGYPKSQLDTSDRRWLSSIAAAEAIRRRCLSCHDRSMPLPQYLSDDLGLVLSNPDPDDARIRWSRHLVFNLSRPEKSLLLLAPLSKQAGGYGLCRPKDATSQVGVFPDRTDRDYQKILTLCLAGKDHLDRIKRFDMPGFRPPAMYVREMKRYGIMPEPLDPSGPVDVYATDQAYWRSLWWLPQGNPLRSEGVVRPGPASP